MKPLIRFASIVTVILSLTAAVRADQEYVWTGGSAGYSGWIILDSNSDASGTLADVVSAQVTTPQGTYNFDPSWVFYIQSPFDWNPTQINDMWIDWYQGGVDPAWAGLGEKWGGAITNFDGSGSNRYYTSTWAVDYSGSWTAAAAGPSVPDATATSALLLLGGAFVGLAALRSRFAR
jgi:hypothetical protein